MIALSSFRIVYPRIFLLNPHTVQNKYLCVNMDAASMILKASEGIQKFNLKF